MSFLGVLGKIGGAIVGAAAGVATGGPIGGIVGGLTGLGVGGSKTSAAALPSTFRGLVGSPMSAPRGTLPAFSLPAGFAATTPAPVPLLTESVTGCPRGYHLGKRKSLLHPFGGCHKNRHMRVTNPHALRRSIRRVQGFEKLARRVLRITSPHKTHKISGFKRTRKR